MFLILLKSDKYNLGNKTKIIGCIYAQFYEFDILWMMQLKDPWQ